MPSDQGLTDRFIRVEVGPPRRSLRKVDTELKALQHQGRLMVWWYGPMGKVGEGVVPKVKVYFRLLDGNKAGTLVSQVVALTDLGALRIGSVWDGGRLVADRELEIRDVSVDFGAWEWVTSSSKLHESLDRKKERGRFEALVSPEHPLLGKGDDGWLIRLPVTGGTGLFVPCLEEYSRRYGRSQEVKRVLATYDFGEAWDRLLAFPAYGSTSPDANLWAIGLGQRIYDSDALFLAHLAYDPFTRTAAKRVYAQLAADANHRMWTQPRIMPWHAGRGVLRVAGVPLDGNTDFLALQILGSTDPKGTDVQSSRALMGGSLLVDVGDLEVDGLDDQKPTRRRKRPKIAIVVNDQSPDTGGGTVVVDDPLFEVLGTPRPVYHARRATNGRIRLSRSKVGGERSVSPGERRGKGKGVAHGSGHTPETLDSQGVLLEVWHALEVVAERLAVPRPVSLTIFDDTVRPVDGCEVMLFAPEAGKHSNQATPVPPWAYLNPEAKTPRGFLVAALTVKSTPVYLVEVERRQRKSTSRKSTEEAGEERYCGMIVTFERDVDASGIRQLKDSLLAAKGIMTLVAKTLSPPEATATRVLSQTRIFLHRETKARENPYAGKGARPENETKARRETSGEVVRFAGVLTRQLISLGLIPAERFAEVALSNDKPPDLERHSPS